MLNYFKKSFLLLITAIFLTQSLFIACSTEVDSEVKKIEEEKPSVPTIVKKTHNVTGIPESWAETDVYAYAYNTNGDKILIPVTIKDGVATFEADETYTNCVLVSLPKGADISAYSANPASILNADCQKSEVIDLTKGSLAFVLAKSDYIGIWNSLEDKLVLNEDGTFSLDIGKDDSAECKGTYVDTKTGVKATYSEKVEETDVQKNIEFTKKESDVLVGSINEKDTYFVKSTNETPNLNGTWKNSDETTTTIINSESEKIYVKVGETEIWGTIVQDDNMFILQDEESNVIGTGFVSAAGNAYIYNEATGTYEIFTRNGSATESDSTIPLKMFTVTYKSGFADDDVQEKPEGTVLELPTPSYKGYRFDGWYTDSEKTKKAEATYTIVENLTFYAKWVQQGTVKFISEHSEHPDVTVDLGKEITIEDPTKEKFAFDGWFDGETKVSGKYVVTKDVELVAKWTALYNVTFETAGGSEVEPRRNVRAGTVIKLPPTTLDGYDFEWWSAGDLILEVGDEYTVEADVIFTAKWAGLCTVVYNTNGGTAIKSVTLHDDDSYNLAAAPTKDGYRFLGWYTTDENSLMNPGDLIIVNDNLEVNAKWVAVYTYEYNDGIPADEDPNYQAPTVDDGYVLTLKSAPVREGYVFKGWKVGEQLYDAGATYTITSNVTFVAVWNELYYYYYDRNDGVPTDLDISSLPKEENGTVITVGPAIERAEYVFKGWSDGEQIYQPDASYTITKNVVFKAQWNPEYTYQFEGSEAETVENGTKITIADAPEAEGCSFGGWSDGVTVWQPGDAYTITADVEFTPIWNVKVYYNSYFSDYYYETYEKGSSITLPPLTHDGYTFGGWDNGSETIPGGTSFVVDADITFTAVWTKDPVAYSISGVPTNETWTSGPVVAWVWYDDVATGFYVEPNLDKDTGDYTFVTAEDISYCTLFVVDPIPSEPITKDTLVENSTAKSADMDISSGNAVFETYKEVYTITNVAVNNWYQASSYNNYIKISGDEEVWIEAEYDAENETLTFKTDKAFDTCVVCGFSSSVEPVELDLSTYTDSELKKRSVVLVMSGTTAEFAYDERRNLADTNIIYFRDEKSWQHNGDKKIYAHFSSTTSAETATIEMENINYDSWFKTTVDYEKFDTVYFTGNDSSVAKKTKSMVMTKDCIFYRPSNNEVSSNTFGLFACVDTVEDPDN